MPIPPPHSINPTTRKREPIPRRDIENNIDIYASENGSPENRIKNDVTANDRQIYKFFSNSAPPNDGHVNVYNHPVVGFNNMSIVQPQLQHIPTAIHNPTQHCNNCRRLVPILCNSCCRNDLNPSYFCCNRCTLLQQMDVCNNCRRAWVQSWNHNDVERCGMNNNPRDNRPQILEITYQDHSSQTDRATSPCRSDRSQPTTTESSNGSFNSLGHDNHSSMTQSDKVAGIDNALSDVPDAVSLSKDDELLELKRRNDILIAKYARNYGSLRKRNAVLKERKSQVVDDSFPLPLMREHLTTTTTTTGDTKKQQQTSRAVSKLEYR